MNWSKVGENLIRLTSHDLWRSVCVGKLLVLSCPPEVRPRLSGGVNSIGSLTRSRIPNKGQQQRPTIAQ